MYKYVFASFLLGFPLFLYAETCALKNTVSKIEWPAHQFSKTFNSADEAAKIFAQNIRQAYSDQRVEYCTHIYEIKSGQFVLGEIIIGNANHCPIHKDQNIKKKIAASIHSHPVLRSQFNDLSFDDQYFSDQDYAVAEHKDFRSTSYLVSPSGMLLKYEPGHTVCRGHMVKHEYSIVLKPLTAVGELRHRPEGEFVYKENLPFCKK